MHNASPALASSKRQASGLSHVFVFVPGALHAMQEGFDYDCDAHDLGWKTWSSKKIEMCCQDYKIGILAANENGGTARVMAYGEP